MAPDLGEFDVLKVSGCGSVSNRSRVS